MFVRASFISLLISAVISRASPAPGASLVGHSARLAARDISCNGDPDWCTGENGIVSGLNGVIQGNLDDNAWYNDGQVLGASIFM